MVGPEAFECMTKLLNRKLCNKAQSQCSVRPNLWLPGGSRLRPNSGFAGTRHSSVWGESAPSSGPISRMLAHREVTERICMSPSNPTSMQADMESENSSKSASPLESKSFSACRISWDPSQTHFTFSCQDLCLNSSKMSRAPAAPTCGGTPLQTNTIRYMFEQHGTNLRPHSPARILYCLSRPGSNPCHWPFL